MHQLVGLGAARLLLAADDGGPPLSGGVKLIYILVSVFLIVLSGLMAGLTLGLLSIDRVDIEVLKRSGTPKQRWLVQRIQPVIRHPHFLLVSLLLVNAAAYETLPIFLDRLLNPLAAILISTTAVLLFGEIMPQAVCKKWGMEIGAYLSCFVRGLMIVTSPISYPIALILDWLLGEEVNYFRRAELKALVDLHAEPHDDDGGVSTLTQDEVEVIQGALDMATKTAEAAMTPLEKVFMFPNDAIVNDGLVRLAVEKGHSRVPVYEGSRQNLVGLILVKELALADEDAGLRVRDLRLRELPFLRADTPMFEALKIFRMGRSHMAVLTRAPATTVHTTPDEELGLEAASTPASAPAPAPAAPNPTPLSSAQGLPPTAASASSGHFSASGSCAAGLHVSHTIGKEPLCGLVITAGGGEAGEMQQQLLEAHEAIGIITIEDVLEELLQQEIVDETDMYVDNLQTVRATTQVSLQHLPPNLRKFMTRTFRTRNPINRAAFQAALAAHSPFVSQTTGPEPSVGMGGEIALMPMDAGGRPPTPSKDKLGAVAAAIIASASAAALAEEGLAAAAAGSMRGPPLHASSERPRPASAPGDSISTSPEGGSPEKEDGEDLPLLKQGQRRGAEQDGGPLSQHVQPQAALAASSTRSWPMPPRPPPSRPASAAGTYGPSLSQHGSAPVLPQLAQQAGAAGQAWQQPGGSGRKGPLLGGAGRAEAHGMKRE